MYYKNRGRPLLQQWGLSSPGAEFSAVSTSPDTSIDTSDTLTDRGLQKRAHQHQLILKLKKVMVQLFA